MTGSESAGMNGGWERERPIGDLMLVDCAASPFLGHRSTAVIDSQPAISQENVLGFQFVGKGVELVREGDRELALTRDRVLAVCPRLGALDALPSLVHHFSRVFKREFGATPSEIRQAAVAAAG
jgi:hypothetical protein